MHRHALQHHRGGLLVADALGDFDHALGRHHARLAIGAGEPGISDAIACLQVLHALAHGLDHARGLVAGHHRQLHRVEARALIGIDEVDPDRGVPDAHLSRTGVGDRDVVHLQCFRSAVLMETDCLRHACFSGEWIGYSLRDA